MEECSICYDPFLVNEEYLPSIVCPNGHKFHTSCIIKIIKSMSRSIILTCPLCRAKIYDLDKVKSIIKKQGIVLQPEASWGSDLGEHRQQQRETRGQGTLTLVIGAATISGAALTMLPPHIGTTIAAMSAAFTIFMVFDPNLRGGTRRKKSIKRLKRGGNKFITGEIDFSLPNPLDDFLGKIDKLNKQYAGKENLYCIKFEHIDLETSKMLLKMLTLDIPIHVSKI